MRLSTKGRYGLRAVVDLAVYSSDGEAVSISSIAARQSLSESYLEQLIAKLKRAGLVHRIHKAVISLIPALQNMYGNELMTV